MPAARARKALLALALAIASPAAPCIELGTLFNTPEERARLDRLRRGEPETSSRPAQAGIPQVTGFVKRSDGRHTLWIDGAPVAAGTPEVTPLLEPQTVRAYSRRSDETLSIERKTTR